MSASQGNEGTAGGWEGPWQPEPRLRSPRRSGQASAESQAPHEGVLRSSMEVLPGAPSPQRVVRGKTRELRPLGPACCVPGLLCRPMAWLCLTGTRPSSPQGFQDRGRQSGHPPGHGCPRGRAHRHLPCAVHPGRQAAGQGECAPRASPSCRPPRSALPSVWDPRARGAAVGEGAVPTPRAQHWELCTGPLGSWGG